MPDNTTESTAKEPSSAFSTWLKRHPCTREELWKIQNMLGDVMPNTPIYAEALAAWQCKENPDANVPAVNHAEGIFSELTACIVFLSDEGYGLTADRLMDARDGFRKIKADHARLIQAVQNGEGVQAFADLHFPPAA